MNIVLEAIKDTDNYTLHAHTQFCDGHAPMADFIAEAAKQGFDVYGFTPHSPIPIYSTCNMSKEDVPAYLAEARRLRDEYPQIKIFAGMEVDYLGEDWGPNSDYFKSLPLDFIIGSVHFIPSQDGDIVDIDGRFPDFQRKMSEHFHNDIRYVVNTFFNQSQKMIAAGGFDIIGHFDKIKHNAGLYHDGLENEPWYQNLVNDLIDNIIASEITVEINTKAWAEHKQLFPAQRHWKRLLQAGVNIIVNSDAHYPKLIDASRRETLKALNYLKTNNQN